jgi:ligand-binding sensor domain-containing protein
MRLLSTISSAIWLLLSSPLFGQQYPGYLFRHIGQTDGLLTSGITSITQDKRGFIWIGTLNGLQRYDGTRFLNYREQLKAANRNIAAVLAWYNATDNNLMLRIDKQLKKLDLSTGAVSEFDTLDIQRDLAVKTAVYLDSGGRQWQMAGHCLYRYDGGRPLPYLSTFSDQVARDEQRHQTWVATLNGLLLFDDRSGRMYSRSSDAFAANSYSAGYPLVRMPWLVPLKNIRMDSRNNLWISTWSRQFFRYDMRTQQLSAYSLDSIVRLEGEMGHTPVSMEVNAIFEDDHHVVWLGTTGAGLLRYDAGTGQFQSFPGADNDRGIQFNNEIGCLFQDREGNIWLGSDKGISIFNPYQRSIRMIAAGSPDKNNFLRKEINGVVQTASGNVLIGTWGNGLTQADREGRLKQTTFFNGPNEANLVWSLIRASDGKIWIGCQHGYLHVGDAEGNNWVNSWPDAMQGSTIRCMQIDHQGNLLFGLHNGLVTVWNKREQTFFPDIGDTGREALSPVHAIFIDRAGHYWIGTENGLKEFDAATHRYKGVYFPPDSAGFCLGIEEWNDSLLMVGLMNHGLKWFNRRTGTFSAEGIPDELAGSTVHAIRVDRERNVWVTTDYQLYEFQPFHGPAVSYNLRPMAFNSAFESSGLYPMADGSLMTATQTELLNFFPDSLNHLGRSTLAPMITGVRLFGQPLVLDSAERKNSVLDLTYRQNFLTLEFSVFLFMPVRETHLFYRIPEINKNWTLADATHTASYSDLPPGRYSFEVRAEDGVSEGRVETLQIAIAPPFWQTWWFRAALVVALAGAVALVMRRRVATVRTQEAFKQQIAEAEMMALRAQMNPHFIFNCINSIDAMIQSNDKYHATMYLNKFARLIRGILDSSKQKTVPISQDIETLRLYIELEQFRHDDKFTYEIHADPAVLQEDYRVPPLVIQPYVENAILHGIRHRKDGGGKLSISIGVADGHLLYHIEDNGVGMQSAARQPAGRHSYGIQMSNDRVRLFNGENKASVDITYQEDGGQPTGTQVRVILKIV